MSTSNNISIISKFITKEVEYIYQRYNSIPEDELNKVKQFIQTLEKNHLNFDPYRSYAATKTTAEICAELEDIDIIRLYLFILDDLGLDIKAEDTKEAYMDLIEKGYCKIPGYYLYKDEETMKELARDELDCKLDDTEQVADMFDVEDLANLWVFGTSKQEAAKQYMRDNEWWEILGCEQGEEGYTDYYGDMIYYSLTGEEV
ncbi:hypothetical protein HBE96_21325 [Clostridium sp. P21]|uniref:Uncharacterized protein n=1 Tax=Clostridium muellerianum TaxID=2716538 RepID=A0A7Y0HPK1_9CLOT|nr:hypothetical protein [Clostridium muellerianum]NMM65129.1 hypothetical protein [Clostridium muellerianum]